jgi:hypothetical protein
MGVVYILKQHTRSDRKHIPICTRGATHFLKGVSDVVLEQRYILSRAYGVTKVT